MAVVTFQEANLKIRYQAAGEGAQTLARFFQPRPEALHGTWSRNSQARSDGSDQLRSKAIKLTSVAGAQIEEGANIRPIEFPLQKPLEGLRPKRSIGQSEIWQVAYRVSTDRTKKPCNPKIEQFSQ